MKLVWLTRKIQACYLCGGFLVLAVCLLLASTSFAQLANTTIAFVSDRDWDWKAEKDRNLEIYLMAPNGKQIRRLTEQPKFDTEPAWSPNGRQITFVSYRDLEQLPKRLSKKAVGNLMGKRQAQRSLRWELEIVGYLA